MLSWQPGLDSSTREIQGHLDASGDNISRDDTEARRVRLSADGSSRREPSQLSDDKMGRISSAFYSSERNIPPIPACSQAIPSSSKVSLKPDGYSVAPEVPPPSSVSTASSLQSSYVQPDPAPLYSVASSQVIDGSPVACSKRDDGAVNKRRRVVPACHECYSAKAKCDRMLPSCSRCVRLYKKCRPRQPSAGNRPAVDRDADNNHATGNGAKKKVKVDMKPTSHPSRPPAARGRSGTLTQSQRLGPACHECHVAKAKCDRREPSCARCSRLGKACRQRVRTGSRSRSNTPGGDAQAGAAAAAAAAAAAVKAAFTTAPVAPASSSGTATTSNEASGSPASAPPPNTPSFRRTKSASSTTSSTASPHLGPVPMVLPRLQMSSPQLQLLQQQQLQQLQQQRQLQHQQQQQQQVKQLQHEQQQQQKQHEQQQQQKQQLQQQQQLQHQQQQQQQVKQLQHEQQQQQKQQLPQQQQPQQQRQEEPVQVQQEGDAAAARKRTLSALSLSSMDLFDVVGFDDLLESKSDDIIWSNQHPQELQEQQAQQERLSYLQQRQSQPKPIDQPEQQEQQEREEWVCNGSEAHACGTDGGKGKGEAEGRGKGEEANELLTGALGLEAMNAASSWTPATAVGYCSEWRPMSLHQQQQQQQQRQVVTAHPSVYPPAGAASGALPMENLATSLALGLHLAHARNGWNDLPLVLGRTAASGSAAESQDVFGARVKFQLMRRFVLTRPWWQDDILSSVDYSVIFNGIRQEVAFAHTIGNTAIVSGALELAHEVGKVLQRVVDERLPGQQQQQQQQLLTLTNLSKLSHEEQLLGLTPAEHQACAERRLRSAPPQRVSSLGDAFVQAVWLGAFEGLRTEHVVDFQKRLLSASFHKMLRLPHTVCAVPSSRPQLEPQHHGGERKAVAVYQSSIRNGSYVTRVNEEMCRWLGLLPSDVAPLPAHLQEAFGDEGEGMLMISKLCNRRRGITDRLVAFRDEEEFVRGLESLQLRMLPGRIVKYSNDAERLVCGKLTPVRCEGSMFTLGTCTECVLKYVVLDGGSYPPIPAPSVSPSPTMAAVAWEGAK